MEYYQQHVGPSHVLDYGINDTAIVLANPSRGQNLSPAIAEIFTKLHDVANLVYPHANTFELVSCFATWTRVGFGSVLVDWPQVVSRLSWLSVGQTRRLALLAFSLRGDRDFSISTIWRWRNDIYLLANRFVVFSLEVTDCNFAQMLFFNSRFVFNVFYHVSRQYVRNTWYRPPLVPGAGLAQRWLTSDFVPLLLFAPYWSLYYNLLVWQRWATVLIGNWTPHRAEFFCTQVAPKLTAANWQDANVQRLVSLLGEDFEPYCHSWNLTPSERIFS